MKFLYLYNLLLEDKIDDLVKDNSYLESYANDLRDVYSKLSEETKKHNKFNKFLKWLTNENTITNAALIKYTDDIDFFFKMYLKYNINLDSLGYLNDLQEYIIDKERIKNIKSDPLIKIIYEDNEKFVIKPWIQKAVSKYGSSTWCIYKQESFWFDYILGEKNHYIVIYKSPNAVMYELPNGNEINLRKACIQIDLADRIYITNSENTVGLGVTNMEADNILQFMKLDKSIFNSYKNESIEDLRKFNDMNKLLHRLDPESNLYSVFIKVLPEEERKKLEDVQNWWKHINDGNIEEIKRMIEGGFDINIRNKYGETILHNWSAEAGNKDKIEFLLTQPKLDINATDQDGKTAFMWYCKQNTDIDVLQLYLARKDLNVTLQDNEKLSALFYSCQSNNKDFVKALLDSGRFDINETGYYNNSSLLVYCAQEGLTSVVEFLISQPNIDLTKTNEDGNNVINYLTYTISLIIKLLETPQFKGKINAIKLDDRPILIFAIREGKKTLFDFLMKDPDIDINIQSPDTLLTSLMSAIQQYNKYYLDALLYRKDLDINKQDEYGKSAIFFAAYEKWDYAFEALLTHPKIDLYIKKNTGHDIYHYSYTSARYRQMILDAGYNIK